VNEKLEKIRFLTLAEVLSIYEDQIRRYGGKYGVRDLTLLNSALAMPESTFDKSYLHISIPSMAAAYAYHISENHPFIDGNKRTALAVALVFLDINGFSFNCPENDLYEMMMSVASGEIKKVELSRRFEKYSEKY
jgi:death on curing protein